MTAFPINLIGIRHNYIRLTAQILPIFCELVTRVRIRVRIRVGIRVGTRVGTRVGIQVGIRVGIRLAV